MVDMRIAYIVAPIMLSLIINGVVFATRKQNENMKRNLLPPGWAIGTIWVILLGLIGYANYVLHGLKDFVSLALVTCIILACLTYPLYTQNFKNESLIKIGNSSNLVFAFLCSIIIAMRSPKVLPYILPLLIWNSYVVITDVARS